jgi:hypothetical protein
VQPKKRVLGTMRCRCPDALFRHVTLIYTEGPRRVITSIGQEEQ